MRVKTHRYRPRDKTHKPYDFEALMREYPEAHKEDKECGISYRAMQRQMGRMRRKCAKLVGGDAIFRNHALRTGLAYLHELEQVKHPLLYRKWAIIALAYLDKDIYPEAKPKPKRISVSQRREFNLT